MNGYDEAVAWLREHAPDWELKRADTSLRGSTFVGGPTERHTEVVLVPVGSQFRDEPEVILTGQGGSIVEAAQAAVGALDRSPRPTV